MGVKIAMQTFRMSNMRNQLFGVSIQQISWKKVSQEVFMFNTMHSFLTHKIEIQLSFQLHDLTVLLKLKQLGLFSVQFSVLFNCKPKSCRTFRKIENH